jgi:hypothetical protein
MLSRRNDNCHIYSPSSVTLCFEKSLCSRKINTRIVSAEYPNTAGKLYLHIGPSGDCWTGASIFAAKHLQPDYVKSIELPSNTDIELLLELVNKDNALQVDIYDNERLPDSLLQQIGIETSDK